MKDGIMAKEQYFQSKIIKAIESRGGHAITGTFSRAGEADIQAGYPVTHYTSYADETTLSGIAVSKRIKLYYLAVEVKTEKDYARVMKCINIVDGLYQIIADCKGLKPHEPLQITKINNVRKKGGLAIIAYDFKQVEQYVKENT